MKKKYYSILQIGVLIMSLLNCNAADKTDVRRPAVANRFYTGNPTKLRNEIMDYLQKNVTQSEPPQIIISPHAGYVFSGPVAGYGFSTIKRTTNKVILIGPSHHKYFQGISIADVNVYETPLGKISLNKNDIKKLRTNKIVHAHYDAHSSEHCLEVQLPFLQVLLSDFTIIPIITGNISDLEQVADLIFPLIDENTLVVISTDLSHFQTNTEAKKIDAKSVETILNENTSGFLDACGETPIRIGMFLAKKMNLKPKLLDARTSFETSPPEYADENRVVGYMSIVYLPNEKKSGK